MDANIIAIQVFSRRDRQTDCGADPAPCVRGMTSDVIRGLERVLALSESFNIAAVNLSLGGNKFTENCDASEPGRKAAIDNLRSRGIAVIAASGNNGFIDGTNAPACISSAISVGSTDDGSANTTQDAVSSFSNTASFLNLLAPGRWISSSVPGGGFRNIFGTSMAAPHVAGAWAVLKQKAPSASVSRILEALTTTGLPVTDTRIYYNPSSGAPNPTGTQLRLLAFTGPAGQPPNRPSFSFDQMMTFPTVPPNGDFVDFEIANGPSINAGQDLFVGFQTPSMPLAVFGDANRPQQNRSYISSD